MPTIYTIAGTAGDDVITASDPDGIYFITGEGGNDQITGEGLGDNLDGGNDNDVISGLGGDDFIEGGQGDDTLLGGDGADTIEGSPGDDFIDGGAGADIMEGGPGNDTFVVDDEGDLVGEGINNGIDTVRTSLAAYALGPHVENLTGTSTSGGQTLTGNELDNIIIGSAAGANIMIGLGGNDTYVVHNSGDVIVEAVGQGNDRVVAHVSYVLTPGAEVETMVTADAAATTPINLTGNEFGQSIFGNAGNNILNGAGGDDQLVGLAGNDVLIGGAGADVLRGGTDNDAYRVDDLLDQVFEAVGEGDDAVYASLSYTLAAGAEVETLSTTNDDGTDPINLTGNDFGQSIFGNAGNNRLEGAGGIDQLLGRGGDDLLIGGAGADVLRGGTGDDTYRVDNALDSVFESAGEGDDAVQASVDFVLTAGAAVETLTTIDAAASDAINLTGNDFAQSIFGNAGANRLSGDGSADSLNGLAGNDVLIGGGGSDVLRGGAGQDEFRFDTNLGAGNVDLVIDFSVADDTMTLDDAVFAGLPLGTLSADAFVIGPAAADANDRIIYDQATGALYFDADGNNAGAAVQFATLQTGLALTNADFVVI